MKLKPITLTAMFCLASAYPVCAQGPVDVTETWPAVGTAGWTNDSAEVTLSNPGGYLNMEFYQQFSPSFVSDIARTDIGPGILPTNITFRFNAFDIAPSRVSAYFHSSQSGNSWYLIFAAPAAGVWTTYSVPADYSAGWVMGPLGSQQQFLSDLRSVDRIGVSVRRHGSVIAQNYGIDDFRVQGGAISGLTITEPDASTIGGAGKQLTISWSGAWPLDYVDVVLWQGINAWTLASGLTSPGTNMTWQTTLPLDLSYATDYFVRVTDTTYTWDFADSSYFTVNFVDVTDIVEAYLLEDTRYLDRQTGTIFATLRIHNLPTSGKRLQGDFWFAVQKTASVYLINPDGTLADGKEYIDITAKAAQAMQAAYGRAYLDPDETIDVPNIQFYSRDRSVPSGYLYILWADPDPDNDRDSDGMPNAWEILHLLDPDSPLDALLDSDDDGMNNFAEYRAGTDPNDPYSQFELGIGRTNRPAMTPGVILQWSSIPDRTYAVWRATNLMQGFVKIDSAVPATPPMNVYEDATAMGRGPYYYRIEVE